MLKKLKLLIIGGAGAIGSNLSRSLSNYNEVIVIDNLSYSADLKNIPNNKQIEFIWCDIVNEQHTNYIFKK